MKKMPVLLLLIIIVFNACSGRTERAELLYLNHIKHRTEIDNTVEKERTVAACGSTIHAVYKETVIEDMHYKIHVYQGLDANGNEVLLHYSVKGEREILTKYAKMKRGNAELTGDLQLGRDECYAIALETVKKLPVDIKGIDVSLSRESVREPNGASASGTDERIRRTKYVFEFEWALNDIVYYRAAISVYSDGDIAVIDCDPGQDNRVTSVLSVLSETSALDRIAENMVAGVTEKTAGIPDRKCIGKTIITTPEGKKYIRYVYSFSKTENENYTDDTSDVLVFIPV